MLPNWNHKSGNAPWKLPVRAGRRMATAIAEEETVGITGGG